MLISNRIRKLRVSPIRKLIPYAENCEKRGINVLKLNIGQPDIDTPQEYFDAISNYHLKILEYSHSRGSEEFIESCIEYYANLGIHFEYEDILATQGASEALMFVMMAVCDADENILTPEPFYANYNTFSDMVTARIKPITTYTENSFRLPEYEELKTFVDDKTRAILISNPNNPTGRVYTEEEIDAIIRIAKEFDLFIISDEVYREFNYSNTNFVSFAKYEDIADRVIVIDSISKRYSCCGARIGNIASKNKELIDVLLKLTQSRLSVSTLELHGASSLPKVPKQYLENTVNEYRSRRDLIYKRLKEIEGIKCSEPEGAFYVIVKLPVQDAEKFVIWMLENISINGNTLLITPINDFYITDGLGVNEVRISYCVNNDTINKAIDILDLALSEYKKIEDSL